MTSPAGEISRECHDHEHRHCSGFAGDYETWICVCRCHERTATDD